MIYIYFFLTDPDGFVIRKWNSKQLNNGIMVANFQVTTTFKRKHKSKINEFQAMSC